MKISRRQLRLLINKTINEGRYIIVGPDGVAHKAKDAFKSGAEKDRQALGKDTKLDTLLQDPSATYRKQARALARASGFQEDLTPEEYTAVDRLGRYTSDLPDAPVDVLLDPDMLFDAIKNRMTNSIIIKKSGMISNRDATTWHYYMPELANEISILLGCDFTDTMTYDREEPSSKIGFDTLDEFLDNKLVAREATRTRYRARLTGLEPILDHEMVEYDGIKFLYSAYDDWQTITFCF